MSGTAITLMIVDLVFVIGGFFVAIIRLQQVSAKQQREKENE